MHSEHRARDTDDCAAGPHLPVAHTVPIQLSWSTTVVYIPGLQSTHLLTASLYLPVTQCFEHDCDWLASLLRYVPVAHVLSTHGELSVFTENLPELQGTQDVSAVAIPGTKPAPAMHDSDVVCATHASPPMLVEYIPTAHTSHPASAVALPGVGPFPVSHDETECGAHASPPMLAEYIPTAHTPHPASAVALPGVRPFPVLHDETECGAH